MKLGLEMTASGIETVRKWYNLIPDIQNLLVNNVFCATCNVTTIVEYSIQEDRHGIVLVGKCKKCGEPVARLVEQDSLLGLVRNTKKPAD